MMKMMVRLFVGRLNCMEMAGEIKTSGEEIVTLTRLTRELDEEDAARKHIMDIYAREVLGENGNAQPA